MKEYRFLTLITGLFVAVYLISNVAAVAKWVSIGPFVFDAGTILFPISYILGDILTEVYGYQKSRQVIWIGFIAIALMSAMFALAGVLPPAPGWENQDAYDRIFSTTPRVVIGSMVAYFAGVFANSYIMARMKILTKGRFLFARTISSTLVGEGVDTLIFPFIGFLGILPVSTIIAGVISQYIFKVSFEILATPLIYVIVGYLKRKEQIDVYDYKTNFNPFAIFWRSRPGAGSHKPD
ncbi:MAG TPA: queuosine precursor transporter [Dehalococcoidales bacterium]|nr:queuosine precursor transporter [Dehalococcoidales bacterium]